MNLKIRLQLSAMMFLEYLVWGAWYVTLGTYLGSTLKFDGSQIGLVFAAFAIAAMISPFFVGMIADRFFPTERVLGILHLLGGGLLFLLTTLTDFGAFYICTLAYTLCFMPTIALTNSLAFQNMENPGKNFSNVRVLGTVSWILVGLLIGALELEPTVYPIMIAAGASVLMGLYSFTLPHTPPKSKGEKATVAEVLGLDALKLLKNRSFAILFVSSLLICIPLSFYYAWANPFLFDVGMENSAAKMTLGQMSEGLFLILMPLFFVRLGYKKMLMMGMACWVLRYVMFMYGDSGTMVWMLYTGIVLHGLCYDFFFVTGQLYVDEKAPANVRSSAQGMITFATYGAGMFIGSYLSGLTVDAFSASVSEKMIYQWHNIWLVPAILSAVVLIFFTVFFKESKAKISPVQADHAIEGTSSSQIKPAV